MTLDQLQADRKARQWAVDHQEREVSRLERELGEARAERLRLRGELAAAIAALDAEMKRLEACPPVVGVQPHTIGTAPPSQQFTICGSVSVLLGNATTICMGNASTEEYARKRLENMRDKERVK